MKKTVLYLLLFGILNSIVFYHYQLGINVLIFLIPFTIFLVEYLKREKLVKNKKGFLFLIPIFLLSLTFTIYQNSLAMLNIVAVPALFVIMMVMVMNPEKELENFILKMVKVAFQPIAFLDDFIKKSTASFKEMIHLTEKQKQITKAIVIVVPIVIIVLLLLSSADKMFSNLFQFLPKDWKHISVSDIIGRLVMIVFFFYYVGSAFHYWKEDFVNDKAKAPKIKISNYTIVLLLTILNVIYVVFDSIQIRSLWLHRVSTGINYAEYARSGFFQLMVISLINLVIILLSKKTKETNYIKGMTTTMIGLTLIIIVSSFFRMFLYEQAYGYTVLRLGVYTILITEAVLLIPTVVYVFNSKMNLLKYYIIIPTVVYCFINCVSIDQIIANNNINRYDRTGKIDIDYLMNYNADNMEQLINLYHRTEDEDIKIELEIYFDEMRKELKDQKFLEYNASREKAYSLLKEKRD